MFNIGKQRALCHAVAAQLVSDENTRHILQALQQALEETLWTRVIETEQAASLVDVRLSEKRDMTAARAFFRSAKAVNGVTPARVTTDGHDSYPRAIRTELGEGVKHRTNQYLNNRIEQTIAGSRDGTDR